MPSAPHPTDLIGGPYRPPRVRVGDRATCLYRDRDVVITSVTAARIPWPRCRRADGGGGGSRLLVTEGFVRAIRTESAAAVKHWLGVGTNTAWAWRKAFGVGQWGTPGSQRLLAATTAKADAAVRGKRLSGKAVRERRERAVELNLVRHLRAHREKHRRKWTQEEVPSLGTMPDTRLARRLGLTRDEVRRERCRRKIPRYRKPSPPEAALSPEEREQIRRERVRRAKLGKKRARIVDGQ